MTEPESYGHNVTRWEADHQGWRLEAGPSAALAYGARRVSGGRIAGPVVTARTLDELAAKVDAPASGNQWDDDFATDDD
jgi:hypothetical protein